MRAAHQLAVDGAEVPAPREPEHDEAAPEPERPLDRWRVSGLFVQPREHNDPEEDRER